MSKEQQGESGEIAVVPQLRVLLAPILREFGSAGVIAAASEYNASQGLPYAKRRTERGDFIVIVPSPILSAAEEKELFGD